MSEETVIQQLTKVITALSDKKISDNSTLNDMIGQKVIIRTVNAGVHYGLLEQKAGNEVILADSRRLWQWHALKSISLSGVANFGIKPEKSNIAPRVKQIWLEAIEIIPCTDAAAQTIESAPDAKAS